MPRTAIAAFMPVTNHTSMRFTLNELAILVGGGSWFRQLQFETRRAAGRSPEKTNRQENTAHDARSRVGDDRVSYLHRTDPIRDALENRQRTAK
jgi:hypothetical protein